MVGRSEHGVAGLQRDSAQPVPERMAATRVQPAAFIVQGKRLPLGHLLRPRARRKRRPRAQLPGTPAAHLDTPGISWRSASTRSATRSHPNSSSTRLRPRAPRRSARAGSETTSSSAAASASTSPGGRGAGSRRRPPPRRARRCRWPRPREPSSSRGERLHSGSLPGTASPRVARAQRRRALPRPARNRRSARPGKTGRRPRADSLGVTVRRGRAGDRETRVRPPLGEQVERVHELVEPLCAQPVPEEQHALLARRGGAVAARMRSSPGGITATGTGPQVSSNSARPRSPWTSTRSSLRVRPLEQSMERARSAVGRRRQRVRGRGSWQIATRAGRPGSIVYSSTAPATGTVSGSSLSRTAS